MASSDNRSRISWSEQVVDFGVKGKMKEHEVPKESSSIRRDSEGP
jgi:hypothetical protein